MYMYIVRSCKSCLEYPYLSNSFHLYAFQTPRGLNEDKLFYLNFLVELQDIDVPFEFAAFGEILGKTGQVIHIMHLYHAFLSAILYMFLLLSFIAACPLSQIAVATVILIVVYVLIVFDVSHMTVTYIVGPA